MCLNMRLYYLIIIIMITFQMLAHLIVTYVSIVGTRDMLLLNVLVFVFVNLTPAGLNVSLSYLEFFSPPYWYSFVLNCCRYHFIVISLIHKLFIMSFKAPKVRKTANPVDVVSLPLNERILRECNELYTNPDKGKLFVLINHYSYIFTLSVPVFRWCMPRV